MRRQGELVARGCHGAADRRLHSLRTPASASRKNVAREVSVAAQGSTVGGSGAARQIAGCIHSEIPPPHAGKNVARELSVAAQGTHGAHANGARAVTLRGLLPSAPFFMLSLTAC